MNPDKAFIRRAEATDAAKIAEMSRRTFYDTFSPYNTKENMDKFMNEQFKEEKLVAECGDPANSFLVACVNDNLVGYVKLRPSDESSDGPGSNSIEIVRIYAIQEVIGQGIGKMLMEAAIQFAREKNYTSIWLGVWDQNERAIAFYKKYGFKKYGSHVFMLGDDAQTDFLFFKKV